MAFIPVGNSSFETPVQTAGGFTYRPTGGTWSFVGNSGIARNASPFFSPNAPDGFQACFIQQTGSLSQVVTGFTVGVVYQVIFQAVQRAGGLGGNTIAVQIDGVTIGSFLPPSSSAWGSFSAQFTATSTSHTLGFLGVNPGGADLTDCIDAVVVTSYPNMIRGTGAAGLGAIGYPKGICLGGPTSYLGDGTFGRHLQCGVREELVDGSPGTPCMALDIPGFFRVRWGIGIGSHSITVLAKQAVNLSPRPSLIVKKNLAMGINSDVSASAPSGAGWVTIGPVNVTATSAGVVWVELWNNYAGAIMTPAFFDHLSAS